MAKAFRWSIVSVKNTHIDNSDDSLRTMTSMDVAHACLDSIVLLICSNDNGQVSLFFEQVSFTAALSRNTPFVHATLCIRL